MPTTDDLDLIRSLFTEPGPPEAVIERGMSRLAGLVAAEVADTRPPAGHRALPRWWAAAATGLAAAGAAVAIVVATGAPGTPSTARAPGTAGHSLSRTSRPDGSPTVTQGLRSPRQILLTAASHAASVAPATGAYWHVAVVTGEALPGGTKAHPFDIVTADPWDKWYARAAGRREWAIGRPPTTAKPMTAADWVAWRAAGSPRGWRLGWIWQGHHYVPNDKGLSMTPAPLEKVWQHGNGVVGHIEGDQQGLTAAQFAALPATVAGLRAYLFRLARRLTRPGPTSSGGLPARYLVWDEGTDLLTDPVSPQVRAAAFRVLAGLPRVRSLGLTRDPLGRPGYALRIGPKVIVVNPDRGALLAYEYLKPVPAIRPGETLCQVHGSYQVIQGRWPRKGRIGRNCAYYAGYYGHAYDGPLSDYSAVLATGWVNSLPPVPRATKSNEASGTF